MSINLSFFLRCASGVTLDTHSCLDPGVPVNGVRYGQDLAIGSVVWFGCEPGYRLSHEERLVCEKNHWWSHPLPTCDGELTSPLDQLNFFFDFYIQLLQEYSVAFNWSLTVWACIMILITFNSHCKSHLKRNFSDSRKYHQFLIKKRFCRNWLFIWQCVVKDVHSEHKKYMLPKIILFLFSLYMH